MKKYLILLLFITASYGQTNYKFDYLLEYQHINYTDSTKNEKIYYLTNSKDNSYFCRVKIKDSLKLNLLFVKQDHIISDLLINKKEFNNNQFINIDCKNVYSYVNHFKFQVNNYDVVNVNKNDSIQTFKIVCLRSEKYIKRNKVGYNLLQFNTNLPFHLPNFEFKTLYEEWNKERDLPNNFVIENSFYDFEGKLNYTNKLINFSQTNKEVNIIINECSSELIKEKILKLKQ